MYLFQFIHQAGVPEHLHGHAVHDPGHGLTQDTVRGSKLYSKYFIFIEFNEYRNGTVPVDVCVATVLYQLPVTVHGKGYFIQP